MEFIFGFFAGMFAPILAIGGWWLLLAIIGFVLLESALVHMDNWGGATFALVVALVATVFFFDPPDGNSWFSLLSATLLSVYAVIYFIIGALWSIGKYVLFLRRKRKQFIAQVERYGHKPGTKEYENEKKNLNRLTAVGNNKSRFFTWIIFWPFSMLAWVAGDLLSNIFNTVGRALKAIAVRIYNAMGGVYNSLRRKVLGDLIDDNTDD